MIATRENAREPLNFLDKVFKYSERGSNIKTEIIGGVTTFLTMAYIVLVNPAILSDAGMDKSALITVTILATAIGTLIFAFMANAPFALAPGMGLNAFFTYSLVIGEGISWQQALGVVFISGCIFLTLALTGLRKTIANAIPKQLSLASAAGIGLFLSFVGLKGMGVVVANSDTLVSLADFTPTVVISLFGLLLMAILEYKKIKGGILISVAIMTVVSIIFGFVQLPSSIISAPPSIAPVAFKLDILGALRFSLIGPIFSFMFIDMFDSLAFLISCCKQMGLEDEKGEIKGLGRMLYADVASTLIGSLLGTSTVTTFGESAAGIAVGARTGLASVVTALLFLVTLIFTPLLSIVPSYAASPALVMVGIFMFTSIKKVDFHDIKIAVPAFITILLMPLTYSISIGLCFGFISYIVMHIVAKETDKINIALWIIGVLSVINLILS
ncbi:NCS2 family permease [Clostridium tarantellae]|uniref:NCS2 family permease n=1 Tax=Clostridium tarantellae TaxID=39493 RepID=A0A6I1MNJ8_9CLOT|nr:NCS2 family permease [Clostridium tarantellae]MPQ44333.1 NCS2 family permease [Clostridium tarantellae]